MGMARSQETLRVVGKDGAAKASAKDSPLPVHVRWMIRRDMAEVLAIEQQAFEFPWYEDDFVRCLRQRNCIGMVAEASERVVGFMVYELHKHRLHILNFAVNERVRRRGVGTQMANKLVSKLSHDRRSRIVLEIRETNLPAQLFFKTLGFRATTVLRKFYEDTPEDAYLMQYRYAANSSAAGEQERTRLAG
jgi:[ribosomal protein S18]-alanine N-acetyltransferase